MIELEWVKITVASKFPSKYEPLLLTFYGMQSKQEGSWIVIGDDYGTKLKLDINDGRLYSIDDNGQYPTRFLNSGLDQLAAFLEAYDRMLSEVRTEMKEEELASFADTFCSRLLSIDKPALDMPDHWWSTIIEQMRDGLL